MASPTNGTESAAAETPAHIPVDLVGWGPGAAYARVYGAVVLLDVGARHESIGLGGVGRKITFTIEMAPFGDEGAGGLF